MENSNSERKQGKAEMIFFCFEFVFLRLDLESILEKQKCIISGKLLV